MKLKKIVGVMAAIGIAAPGVAMATNGMNLEGYGPIAAGMGGASMAYDNGTAAVVNNPATIGLMPEGSRLDLAIGKLGPDVNTSTDMPGMGNLGAPSGGDAYYMPAIGYAKKSGKLAYGVGVFAQGGMGTEYGSDSFLSWGDTGPTGQPVRSEVGVGRLVVPLAYDVDSKLTVAGSIDFIWAAMDLQMLMPGSMMGPMMQGTSPLGTVGGSMVTDRFFPAMGAGQMTGFNWGYFDFSNTNDYSGRAHSTGWGGKLGVTYKINPQLTLGATYHTKTSLGDMEGNASVGFSANLGPAMGPMNGATVPVTVTGKIAVRNFEWPETFGFGMAYQATNKLMVAADYKRINWANVMKDFNMTFTAEDNQADPMAQAFMLGGTVMDATMYQNWENQNVFQFGASYKVTDAWTVRGGLNLANNPVPDSYMNALFPAIVEDHVTAGVGYAFNKAQDLNFSLSYADKNTVTNSVTGVTSSMSQLNWQLMYSHRF